MNVRYCVDLDQSERDELTAILRGGKHPARKLKRAQILLAADAGQSFSVRQSVYIGAKCHYQLQERNARIKAKSTVSRALFEDRRMRLS